MKPLAVLVLCLPLCPCNADKEQLFSACQTTAAEVHSGDGEQIKLRQHTAACMIANGYEIEVSRRGDRCPPNGPVNTNVWCYRPSGLVYDIWRLFELAVLSTVLSKD